MKVDPTAPAYPHQALGQSGLPCEIMWPGLPIRLELAARAMQGMLARTTDDYGGYEYNELLARAALCTANALIAAYNADEEAGK